jgi:hypothetical protein
MSIHTHSVESVLELVRTLGCEVTEQKSFFKVTGPTPKKALYIGKAKRYMTRLDISGFEPSEHPAIKAVSEADAKDLKLGAVRGQILPKTLGEDVDVLDGVTKAVEGLLSEAEGFKLGSRAQNEEDETPEVEEVETEEASSETEVAVA